MTLWTENFQSRSHVSDECRLSDDKRVASQTLYDILETPARCKLAMQLLGYCYSYLGIQTPVDGIC